ncbi:hypothetical protein [Ekhidna sp.]|uniref:hypothetical protein n=1 Tax=Ekhidna sp. TaxID=2608089 RepID=UPI003BA9A6D7
MKHLLIVLMISLATIVQAQNGYLVTLEADSIFGEISILRATNFDEVKIKHANGKQEFKAFKIKMVVKDGETFEPINYANRKTIAKVLAKGTLSYYAVRPENKVQYTERVLYKDDQSLPISSIGFRANAIEFLSDCQTVAFKLEEKELGFTNIEDIVRIYNSSCGSDKETSTIANHYKELINFSQLLFDITSKIENGERVPKYMTEALEKYSDISVDEKVKGLLSALKED